MYPHDDELPDDHAALLRLAADVQMRAIRAAATAELPMQRGIAISDEATALVGDPLVGIITHGR
ncbi:MAG TPA: hypothetical protein VLR26_08900 [Frankiaceae bacterium]|nr:hypothetical protein [Frankiaceae bacterium]